MLGTLDCAAPETARLRFVAPSGAPSSADGVADAVAVAPDDLAGLTAPRMASVLLAAALDVLCDDPAIRRHAAAEPTPRRSRPSGADGDARTLGVTMESLPESELLVHYRPYGSIIRGPMRETLDETAHVEERFGEALGGEPGAAIVDKSAWEWHLRLP